MSCVFIIGKNRCCFLFHVEEIHTDLQGRNQQNTESDSDRDDREDRVLEKVSR